MYAKVLIVLLCVVFSSPSVFADVYKYIDENGVVCYTDAPLLKKAETVHREKQSANREKRPAGRFRKSAPPASSTPSADYHGYVASTASKYEIEPELIQAVIKTESNGNHRAVSRKGAMGLMQLMPSTAVDMNVINPFNPEENIEGGTRYLRYLLEKFNGNITLALAAYNAGPRTVEKYGSVPPIYETKEYVKKVLSLYKGKQSYALSDSVRPGVPTQIFKVVLDDGTVLFTNSSIAKQGNLRF
ncbi:MAG: lytic transglycosylase domain-containing protein [Nitrospiraceae bacterium]|nr:lytic transglycosylase domain-containing protein [Nitrospiraceae bacterium]